jgi:hypothetical protein
MIIYNNWIARLEWIITHKMEYYHTDQKLINSLFVQIVGTTLGHELLDYPIM